jgi:transmembrane sensor
MYNESNRLKYLFEKYFDKTASEDEKTELADLINNEANRDAVMQLFSSAWEKYQGNGNVISSQKADEMLQYILTKNVSQDATVIPLNGHRKFKRWHIAAAAAILIFIGGSYLLTNSSKKPSQQTPVATVPANDVNPGEFKARLTLADGSSIIIDSATLGQLTKQGKTAVINKDGKLVYESEKGNQEVLYNKITTNKGETYSFTLADGSKVWLNSASSVYFPVAFPGKERRIEFTGEVYVQVAKNPKQPFIASAKGLEVLALGTEFNVNAYDDEENINTTLIEGMVKVSIPQLSSTEQNQNVILNPGQQTQLYKNGQLTAGKNVDTDEIIAWKDGLFHFESTDLRTILRQFARWYDVEVVYDGPVKNRKFFGIVKRNSTLKTVLEMLQDNNIDFHIEGKKLVVKSG